MLVIIYLMINQVRFGVGQILWNMFLWKKDSVQHLNYPAAQT